eukprot:2352918-Prorocentrum_lima.AAC.1
MEGLLQLAMGCRITAHQASSYEEVWYMAQDMAANAQADLEAMISTASSKFYHPVQFALHP